MKVSLSTAKLQQLHDFKEKKKERKKNNKKKKNEQVPR